MEAVLLTAKFMPYRWSVSKESRDTRFCVGFWVVPCWVRCSVCQDQARLVARRLSHQHQHQHQYPHRHQHCGDTCWGNNDNSCASAATAPGKGGGGEQIAAICPVDQKIYFSLKLKAKHLLPTNLGAALMRSQTSSDLEATLYCRCSQKLGQYKMSYRGEYH